MSQPLRRPLPTKGTFITKFEVCAQAWLPRCFIKPVRKTAALATYRWFSHDVTKIQTKKLSILPRFYLHDALEQMKTNFHSNFRFKRVLGFVIEYA